jgi:hypothetical protein
VTRDGGPGGAAHRHRSAQKNLPWLP